MEMQMRNLDLKKTLLSLLCSLLLVGCAIKEEPEAQALPGTEVDRGDQIAPLALAGSGDSFEKDKLMSKTIPSSVELTDALEIVGVGVAVETWRNHPSYPKHNLWTIVEQGKGRYVIPDDPERYPRDVRGSEMMNGKRLADATEIALRDFMDRYPLPMAVVGPAIDGPEHLNATFIENARQANAYTFLDFDLQKPYTQAGTFAGLLTQAGQILNSYLNSNPDLLWQGLFQTFDEHADIPAIGVGARDNIQWHAAGYPKGSDDYNKRAEQMFHPKNPRILSDNWTVLTMIKRGRIDWLRPYANLMLDNMSVRKSPVVSRNYSQFAGWLKQPAEPFVPTSFIHQPWTRFQIDQYDHLEILGRVHRPQVVSYLDEHGKPVDKAIRVQRMETALRAALQPLQGQPPARLFYDYNSANSDRKGSGLRYLPFVSALRTVLPEWDLFDPEHSYDLTSILGDLGAGSPFVSVAMASMAGIQSGGATLIVNLRRTEGASVVLVTPPTAQERERDAAIKRPFWPGSYARIRKKPLESRPRKGGN
jgi:hypothetical protein